MREEGSLPYTHMGERCPLLSRTGQNPPSPDGAAVCELSTASKSMSVILEGSQGSYGELRAFFSLSHPTRSFQPVATELFRKGFPTC